MYPIEVKGLVKRFKIAGKPKAVVDNVSFKVKKNEIFGLLGPNGAGKTTTINMLTGLLEKDEGEIRILGHIPEEKWEYVRNRMNTSTAYLSLSDVLTVKQNLRVYAMLFDVKNHEDKIKDLLKKFQISHLAKQRILRLSSGEKTRVSLCKSLINDPEVLFLDECTVGLDPEIAEHTRNLIKDYQDRRECSILFTSHYMYEVEELCNRIAFMSKGKIIRTDSAENLKKSIKDNQVEIAVKENAKDLRTFLKLEGLEILKSRENTIIFQVTRDDDKLYKIMNKIFAKGFKLSNLHIKNPTLDDIFIKFAREENETPPD
ncbi:MAG: ABC transporter ATP-binding protein [Nanoarchaeota archaeon]